MSWVWNGLQSSIHGLCTFTDHQSIAWWGSSQIVHCIMVLLLLSLGQTDRQVVASGRKLSLRRALHWKTCIDLRANLISTKLSASHHKSTQVHASPGQTKSQVDPSLQLASPYELLAFHILGNFDICINDLSLENDDWQYLKFVSSNVLISNSLFDLS